MWFQFCKQIPEGPRFYLFAPSPSGWRSLCNALEKLGYCQLAERYRSGKGADLMPGEEMGVLGCLHGIMDASPQDAGCLLWDGSLRDLFCWFEQQMQDMRVALGGQVAELEDQLYELRGELEESAALPSVACPYMGGTCPQGGPERERCGDCAAFKAYDMAGWAFLAASDAGLS